MDPGAYLAGVLVVAALSQWLAWRLRVPSILVLLVVGFFGGLLATPDEENGILRLNMGEFSKDRTFEGSNDITLDDVDEHFYVFVEGGDIWVEAVIDGKTVEKQNYGSASD